jgi:predicted RNA-binding Zn-ribbon protein involved in translation (DUF1610 family)
MPNIGDVVRASDVGVAPVGTWHKCVWHACPDCGKERWVLLRKGQPQSARCHPCGLKAWGITRRGKKQGPRASNWRGGRQVLKNGYVMVTLAPDDPMAAMSIHKRHRAIYEHRLVMARHLGRLLLPWEEVHHKNKDKQDNRIENLELTDKRTHAFQHQDVDRLMRENEALRAEVERLRRLLDERSAAETA